jgi:hypothetical protein
MDEKTSDRILSETCHPGKLQVTIEGHGTCNVDGSEVEPLKVLADQVWCLSSRVPEFIVDGANPWSLVSYDADAGTLVVRRKE